MSGTTVSYIILAIVTVPFCAASKTTFGSRVASTFLTMWSLGWAIYFPLTPEAILWTYLDLAVATALWPLDDQIDERSPVVRTCLAYLFPALLCAFLLGALLHGAKMFRPRKS